MHSTTLIWKTQAKLPKYIDKKLILHYIIILHQQKGNLIMSGLEILGAIIIANIALSIIF
jgi:hypothetical protein